MAAHDDDDSCSNPSCAPGLGEIIERRLSRRDALKGAAASAAFGLFGYGVAPSSARAQVAARSSLGFAEIEHAVIPGIQVAPGYAAQVVVRWGVVRWRATFRMATWTRHLARAAAR